MAPSENPESALERYAAELADGICAALPGWVVRSVDRVMTAWSGEVPVEVGEAAERAAREASESTGAEIRRLLASDADEQRTTPLALLRGAVRYPTGVLRTAGVPPVQRDRFTESAFPDDDYDLSPSSLADVDPDLAELGIAWGAAKAFVFKQRHASGPGR